MAGEKFDTERIDRFINGTLTEEERGQFESMMQTDPELKAEVELHRDIKVGAQAYFDQELKDKLAAAEGDPTSKNVEGKQASFRLWQTLGVAASAVLLVGLAYIFLNPSADPQELYLSYYQPYPNIVNPLERSQTDLPDDGMSNYEQENYQKAVEVFDQELSENPQSDFRLFYQALSYLEIGEAEKAIGNLQQLQGTVSSDFYQPAQWYLALAYLKNADTQAAKAQLLKLLQNGGDYQSRARELADKL
ncbi:MAG: tetratricopeptide repeat protein [Cyclobacteriaceae bacterium]|nr:tetratricopeptide repeat protein [Cyclobacteriaceae bacterium]